jgi:hypothetical protein
MNFIHAQMEPFFTCFASEITLEINLTDKWELKKIFEIKRVRLMY